jgi:hypothetical protein
MAMVAAGLLNKQVGGELNISEIMVKAHRGQAMRKMKADSLADLVNMAAFHRGSMPGPPGARRGKLKCFIVSYHLLIQVAFLPRLDCLKYPAHSALLSLAEQTSFPLRVRRSHCLFLLT